jgi:CubicO group peptidase (beta-lactamase class C family)
MISDQVGATNWLDPPFNRLAFQRVDSILRTVPISRGSGRVREFGRTPTEIDSLTYAGSFGESTIGAFLDRTFTDGLLVMRGDSVLCERYFNGMMPSTRHILMSVSKPLAGSLAGMYVDAGILGLDDRVADIVPELGASAYGDATVQQVLDMAVHLRFREEYDDPTSEVQTEDRVAGWRSPLPEDPPNMKAFLAMLAKTAPHGGRFQYCSATTDVLAWILERRSHVDYARLLSESLWSKIGAADDAYVTVDAAGFPYACAGVCATMPDLARFGRLVLDGGTWNDEPVIPAGWIVEARQGPGSPIISADEPDGVRPIYPEAVYHNHWWTTRSDRGTFFGVGIFGQFLWLDPSADVLIVKLSSWPAAFEPSDVSEHVLALGALAKQVSA